MRKAKILKIGTIDRKNGIIEGWHFLGGGAAFNFKTNRFCGYTIEELEKISMQKEKASKQNGTKVKCIRDLCENIFKGLCNLEKITLISTEQGNLECECYKYEEKPHYTFNPRSG